MLHFQRSSPIGALVLRTSVSGFESRILASFFVYLVWVDPLRRGGGPAKSEFARQKMWMRPKQEVRQPKRGREGWIALRDGGRVRLLLT